jgi:hypothetical protein
MAVADDQLVVVRPGVIVSTVAAAVNATNDRATEFIGYGS